VVLNLDSGVADREASVYGLTGGLGLANRCGVRSRRMSDNYRRDSTELFASVVYAVRTCRQSYWSHTVSNGIYMRGVR